MLAGLDLLDWYASCFSSSVFIFTFIRERLSGFLLWIDGLLKRFVSLPGELERDCLRFLLENYFIEILCVRGTIEEYCRVD